MRTFRKNENTENTRNGKHVERKRKHYIRVRKTEMVNRMKNICTKFEKSKKKTKWNMGLTPNMKTSVVKEKFKNWTRESKEKCIDCRKRWVSVQSNNIRKGEREREKDRDKERDSEKQTTKWTTDSHRRTSNETGYSVRCCFLWPMDESAGLRCTLHKSIAQ